MVATVVITGSCLQFSYACRDQKTAVASAPHTTSSQSARSSRCGLRLPVLFAKMYAIPWTVEAEANSDRTDGMDPSFSADIFGRNETVGFYRTRRSNRLIMQLYV